MKQLKRQSLACGWPSHILSDAKYVADTTDAERGALDETTVEGLTKVLHIRNAYIIITNMCDGHQVEHLLERVPESHARKALECIRNYFFPGGESIGIAQHKFSTATMENTHTNSANGLLE